MSKSVVLITGCNGLIGEAAARALASDYHTVGADVTDPPDDTPLAEVRHMDVTSHERGADSGVPDGASRGIHSNASVTSAAPAPSSRG